MKNLKLIIVALLSIIMIGAIGQESQKQQLIVPLTNPDKPGTLELGGINCSIFVSGYNGKEVIVDAHTNNGISKITTTGNGMKKITTSSMSIEVEERDNKVEVSSGINNEGIIFEIKVPFNFSLELSTVNNGEIKVENVNGEINASNINGPITIHNVNGLVSASTINDDIKITFDKVTPDSPMAFSTLNGDIDITFPANIKANLKIKNDRGDTYTDFDVVLSKDRKVNNETSKKGVYKVSVDEWIYGKINGGGPEYSFKNFNGDITIRKK